MSRNLGRNFFPYTSSARIFVWFFSSTEKMFAFTEVVKKKCPPPAQILGGIFTIMLNYLTQKIMSSWKWGVSAQNKKNYFTSPITFFKSNLFEADIPRSQWSYAMPSNFPPPLPKKNMFTTAAYIWEICIFK